MKASQLVIGIRNYHAIGRAVMVWGASGIGKSSIVAQMAADDNEDMWDFRGAYRDAVDLMGLPGVRDGKTYYALPAGLPTDPESKGYLFLDEITSAPQQTQAALYQLINDRRIGDYTVPERVKIVAAGNRVSDRGVVHRMPDPLIDRFGHLYLEPDLNDWTRWALSAGVRPEVVAFLRFRPALLHNHDPQRPCHAFSTPRGWQDASKLLDLQSPCESELIRGRVGDGAAGEFMAFLTLFRSMVSPDQILLNPTKAEVPTNAGVLYALAEALARRATVKTIDAVMTYAKRMPMEYAQALVASATGINPEICNTPEFIRWASEQN